MQSTLNLYGAARMRITSGKNTTLAGAILDKPDTDLAASAVETAYTGTPRSMAPLDTLEILIAREVDNGEEMPVAEPNVMRGAQWIANIDPSKWPTTIPRDFVIYLAAALKAAGKYPTMEDAMTFIFGNFEFN